MTIGKSLDHLHHMEWINGIKAGYGSDEYKKITAPFEYAGPFTETVLMGNLAIRSYMSMGKISLSMHQIDIIHQNTISLLEEKNYCGMEKI